MPDNGCCACLHVNYTTYDHKDGTTSGWWECAECHSKFMHVRAYEHEVESLRAELRDTKAKLQLEAIECGEAKGQLQRCREELAFCDKDNVALALANEKRCAELAEQTRVNTNLLSDMDRMRAHYKRECDAILKQARDYIAAIDYGKERGK